MNKVDIALAPCIQDITPNQLNNSVLATTLRRYFCNRDRSSQITTKLGEQEHRREDLNRVRAIPKPERVLAWLETAGRPKEQC